MIAVEATPGGQRVVLSGRWTLAVTAGRAGRFRPLAIVGSARLTSFMLQGAVAL